MRGRSTACFSRLTGCRDVDAGVFVMYTKVCLQARNFCLFLLVFHSWVCVRNGVVWRIHFIFLFFSCFLLLLFCISHSPITVIFPKILCISRPHRYARHKYGLLLLMSVCLSSGYNREPCKNG